LLLAPLMQSQTLAWALPVCYDSGPSEGKRLLACGRCKLARYCAVDCQKAHWPAHKHDCSRLARHIKGPIVTTTSQYPSISELLSSRWSEVGETLSYPPDCASRACVFKKECGPSWLQEGGGLTGMGACCGQLEALEELTEQGLYINERKYLQFRPYCTFCLR
jgi:hypothetical protein